MDKQFDVIVIGAGIAGGSTALQLARMGHRTLLLDRQPFPRHKTCGEFMSPETKEMLEFLGVDLLNHQVQPSRMTKARIFMSRGGEIEAPLPGSAWGISRYELDRLLHEKAMSFGARIMTKTTVTGIHHLDNSRYQVEVREGKDAVHYEAKAVVGAYGTRKPKTVADEAVADADEGYRDATIYVGVKSHYTGIHAESEIELYFCEGGYAGISPLQNGTVNIAALLTLDAVQSSGKSVRDILKAASRTNPRLAARLERAVPVEGTQASIAPVRLSNAPEPWSVFPHVGDALLMIPPLCGDGMSIALRSSLLCSNLTNRYLRNELTYNEWQSEYIKEANREFAQLLRRARWVQKMALAKTNRVYPGIARLFPGLVSYAVKATRLSESGLWKER
ncbi:FAD-dependent oxidoreductase [Paenibacillus sp. DMB20]|uniref:FAD-dependent oxidoreductase n=1 Tax=Paenibacillus sp. DMB20 TaxID=1642570 RepID=UPI000627C721|nr:FAD-dependent oxidoreductase [Paenibacillus sp. DMB20]KKO50917.1 FAD-binding monooxygenase [Paenibacillus sp. DMB20]